MNIQDLLQNVNSLAKTSGSVPEGVAREIRQLTQAIYETAIADLKVRKKEVVPEGCVRLRFEVDFVFSALAAPHPDDPEQNTANPTQYLADIEADVLDYLKSRLDDRETFGPPRSEVID